MRYFLLAMRRSDDKRLKVR